MAVAMMRSMSEIESNYPVNKLLAALVAGYEEHLEEYEAACKGYSAVVLRMAKKYLKLAKNLDPNDVPKAFTVPHNFGLAVPVDCSKYYQEMITIFRSMNDEVIKLKISEANHILNNSWDWIESAKISNSMYYSNDFVAGSAD